MILAPIKLSKRITVGPQPSEEQLERLAKKGFKTIINLSRKGELDQAFKPEEEGERVEDLGMTYIHVPVSLSNIKDDQITEFCEAMEEVPTPAYVHCRIGQRSGPFSLIYHALRRKLSADQVLEKARGLGMEWRAPMIPQLVSQYLKKQAEAT